MKVGGLEGEMNIIKTLFFLFLVPGPLLVWAPYKLALLGPIGQFNLGQFRYTALLPWLAGTLILLWSALDFALKGKGTPAPIDPPKVLVGEGLYRFVRNPMYLGALLILPGHILWFQSFRLLIYAAAIAAAFHLFVVFYEEPVLRLKFGDSYEDYCQSVPRWVPRGRKSDEGRMMRDDGREKRDEGREKSDEMEAKKALLSL